MILRSVAFTLVAAAGGVADSFVEWNPSVDIVVDAPWRLQVDPVAVDGPRVVVKDGHFFLGDRRYRVWGVNLSFGANLPDPEDAAMVADRLAAAGVNSVRMHHMDTAKYPRGLWHREGGLRLDPEALKRMDRFIAELAKCGIRVNLNLHVGAEYSKMLEEVPECSIKYDKLYLQFVPQLQQAWRDYARMLLDRRNPHRGGVRYADDPAIAWVEVSNENSFWFGSYLDDLRTPPPFYRAMLEGQYVDWLKQRYRDDTKLRKSWNVQAEPLGEDLLAAVAAKNKWGLEQHRGARVKRTDSAHDGQAGVRLEPENITGQEWHLQYNLRPIEVEKGKYYTLSFRARADRQRKVRAAVSIAHEPWGTLGSSRSLELGPEWKAFKVGFVALENDEDARVTFSYGAEKVPFELAGVRLQRGGQAGLAKGESLSAGRMALWCDSETTERANDRLRFLAATERAFFEMGRTFIREELGSGALVVGTQGYRPTGLYAQEGMDFIDTHAYWQHPHFPRRSWDPGDWIIGRKAIVNEPQRATFLNLAAHRVPGRAFTVSEYNHPAPNDFQVECVPMMAALAAAEDWDGVWFYTYEHNNDRWDKNLMTSYFDFRANPAKWAFMPGGAALFREAAIEPQRQSFLSTLGPPDAKTTWADPTAANDRYRFHRGGAGRSGTELAQLIFGGVGKQPEDRGFFLRDGSVGAVVIGFGADFETQTDGGIRVSSPEFCAVTVVAMDGLRIDECRRVLVTACGRAENRGMEFNEERSSVGRNWGESPVRAEAVTGTMRLPEGNWRAWALKPDGSRGQEAAVGTEDGKPVLQMSPKHGTICYWLER